jgi:hypothetical protein
VGEWVKNGSTKSYANRGSASTSTFSTKVLVLVEKVEILVEMAIAIKFEACF